MFDVTRHNLTPEQERLAKEIDDVVEAFIEDDSTLDKMKEGFEALAEARSLLGKPEQARVAFIKVALALVADNVQQYVFDEDARSQLADGANLPDQPPPLKLGVDLADGASLPDHPPPSSPGVDPVS